MYPAQGDGEVERPELRFAHRGQSLFCTKKHSFWSQQTQTIHRSDDPPLPRVPAFFFKHWFTNVSDTTESRQPVLDHAS